MKNEGIYIIMSSSLGNKELADIYIFLIITRQLRAL